MKNRISVLFAVLAVAAIFASTAFAAPINGKSVSLVSVDYNEGGVVLKFETSGLTQADLKDATLFANSNYQGIYCTFVDNTTTVRCTAAKSLAGDGNFVVTLAGFTFWGELPENRLPACGEGEWLWYTADVYTYGEFDYSYHVPAFVWDEWEQDGWFDFWESEYGETDVLTGWYCEKFEGFPG